MSKPFTSAFTPPTGARKGYHHGNLREALIDAARFLIAEKGPQGFTLIEAARLANVSPAAPYRHFKDREALVSAVSERGFGLFAERLRSAIVSAHSAETGFEALGRAYLAFAREEPGHYGAMFLSTNSVGGGPGSNDDSFGMLVEAVRRMMARSGEPVAVADPLSAAMQIWSLAHGVAGLAATGRWPSMPGTPSPEDVLRNGATAIVSRGGPGPQGL